MSLSLSLFYTTIHTLLSSHIKQARDHVLVSIKDIYEKTLREANRPTKELKDWEAAARMTASVCHQQKKSIQSNAANLQRRLEREYLEAKRRIEEAEEKRLGVVLGEELEALRQWQELNRVRTYLRRVRSQLSAVEFIEVASRASDMMCRMLNRFRSEGGDSGIVVRENEEILTLIGGRWKVVGTPTSSFESVNDFDHIVETQENASTAAPSRMREEESNQDMITMMSKANLAVPDVCRNAKHVARNLKDGFLMKQSECSCSGLWRYFVLKNMERAYNKHLLDSKCYVRKVRVTLDVEKFDVRYPGHENWSDRDEEKKSDEGMSFWENALVDMRESCSSK